MSMTLPSGRAGRVLALGLAMLLLAMLWMTIAMPLMDWYTSRAEALRDQAALLGREARLVGDLPALQQAAKQTRRIAPAGDVFLAGATDAIAGASLEQLVQTMATTNGVTLSSAEALTTQTARNAARIQLQITVAADWPGLIGLLRSIVTGRPTMLIDNLQVSSQSSPDLPPINATFTVIAFRNASGQTAQAPQ